MNDEADSRQRIEARHREILGQPPRLAPVDRKAVADQVMAVTAHLRKGVVGGDTPLALDAVPEIMFTMCRFPDLWQKIIDLSVQIQGPDSVLDVRDRKLAILRTGWLCQAPFEFGEHVKQSLRAGLGAAEIERVTIGSAAPEWDEHDRAILRAAEELHANAMICDETWAQLSKRLDEHQRVELLVLIGQFTATAYFQNALRLRLEPGNRGLHLR